MRVPVTSGDFAEWLCPVEHDGTYQGGMLAIPSCPEATSIFLAIPRLVRKRVKSSYLPTYVHIWGLIVTVFILTKCCCSSWLRSLCFQQSYFPPQWSSSCKQTVHSLLKPSPQALSRPNLSTWCSFLLLCTLRAFVSYYHSIHSFS